MKKTILFFLTYLCFVLDVYAQTINKVEYFIDTDPGYGNGVNVPITPATMLTNFGFNVPLTSVSEGFHYLYVRARDNNNRWSEVVTRVFMKISTPPVSPAANINKIEYYINTDPGFGNGTDVPITPAMSFNDFAFTAEIGDLPLNSTNTLYVRARDENGNWSEVVRRSFNVCPVDPSIANFDYIAVNNQVTFADSSRNAASYLWDFGDGNTSTGANPVHTYASPNIYRVIQRVTNECNTDTTSRLIVISGLRDVVPKRGGNAGRVTLNIYGAGFINGSQAKIKRNALEIQPDTLLIIDSGHIKAIYNLNEQPLGLYDVSVSIPSLDEFLLPQIFEIEEAVVSEPILLVDGESFVRRPGRVPITTFRIRNTGNTDLESLPLVTVIENNDLDNVSFTFEPDFAFVPISDELNTQEIDFAAEVGSFYDDNELGEEGNQTGRVIPIVIPMVPAGSEVVLEARIDSPTGARIKSWVTPPVKNPQSTETSLNSNVADCLSGIASTITGFIPSEDADNCLRDVFLSSNNYEGNIAQEARIDKAFSFLWNFTATTLNCTTDIFPISNALKTVSNLFGIGSTANSLAPCNTAFAKNNVTTRTIQIINSSDPNEIVGYSSPSGSRHYHDVSSFDYTVYFENIDTASAAAQEVFIIDTLDRDKLDLNTFQVLGFGFSERNIYAKPGLLEFSQDIDMRPEQDIITRVNIKLDTITGVVRAYFGSLDPVTLKLTEDPFFGFLPPNNENGVGEGYIRFSIAPKSDIQHGEQIINTAKIIFDLNEPIITNTWVNTRDLIPPTSNMTNLPATSPPDFNISWQGSDAGSGIYKFDVFIKTDESDDFMPLLLQTSKSNFDFTGEVGKTYAFTVIAYDSVGLREDKELMIETQTTVGEIPTSLNDSFESQIKIYPNPNQGVFHLDIEPTRTDVSLIITNSFGTQITNYRLTSLENQSKHALDISNHPDGVYFIQVISGNQRITKKVLIINR
ncbi:MAG: T9SS type A sorting domain-containing protein [Saprospiraceae bacterium]|nr:T9SS type A sorting domain-containing protein [Saprospiraceae bacterium]